MSHLPNQNSYVSNKYFSRLYPGGRVGQGKGKSVISLPRSLSCLSNLLVHIYLVVKVIT